MRKCVIFCLLFLYVGGRLFSDFMSVLDESDALNREGRYELETDVLLSSLETDLTSTQKAEVYWRLSRTAMLRGGEAQQQGEPKTALYAIFEEGEAFGLKAITADPNNHLGYFWAANNVGRWLQVNMGLKALKKARVVRDLYAESIERNPEYALTYFAISQMYAQVPGKPISFGSIDYAVSLARKAVDIHMDSVASEPGQDRFYGYEIELARVLYKRGWSSEKRLGKQGRKERNFDQGDGAFEKNMFYEGTVVLEPVPDRIEARAILHRIIEEIEVAQAPTEYQKAVLGRVAELLERWDE